MMEEKEQGNQSKKVDQAKDLDSVTDYYEETEVDAGKAQQAISGLDQEMKEAEDAERLRREKLARVKVNPEDVEYLVHHLEMSKDEADLMLRECDGVLLEAVRLAVRS